MSARNELNNTIAQTLAGVLAIDPERAQLAARAITSGWHAARITTPNSDEHPLTPVRHGHYLRIATDWQPETPGETADRQAREAARHWAWLADDLEWDDWEGADEVGPPPERVSINQLLDQGAWWRMRVADRPGSGLSPIGRAQLPTVAVKLADMTHDHRLALLDWLRQRAGQYKSRADWFFAATPGPNGDMAQLAFEAECVRQWDTPAAEWIEDQPLVKALVRWTTPYAESPVTWLPIDEAPHYEGILIGRWSDLPEYPDQPIIWGAGLEEWVPPDPDRAGFGSFETGPDQWRKLRDDEYCEHDVPLIEANGHRLEYCRWCDHGHGPGEGDGCARCVEELARMDEW
jgi:hypothetical protein